MTDDRSARDLLKLTQKLRECGCAMCGSCVEILCEELELGLVSLAERGERAAEMPGVDEIAEQLHEEWLQRGKEQPSQWGLWLAVARFVLSRFRPDREALDKARDEEAEACARLHESINPACDHERPSVPGAGAMGSIIEYRDLIRRRIAVRSEEK